MSKAADAIASCVFSAFDNLPPKYKPRQYDDGSREWVPLSGIVISQGNVEEFKCVALGTGMRCLPTSKVPLAKGRCLHDWHAEIVAIRAFNFFLIEECRRILQENKTSPYIRLRGQEEISQDSPQPSAINDNVQIHMYCSVAPCGDSSMELIMNAQSDATPWERLESEANSSTLGLHGRGFFSKLGIVRRKPGRGDAPDTLSKSCSDKIAMKQCTSLLSSVTSLLIAPENAYLQDVILPSDQFSSEAMERAFGPTGRMSPLLKSRIGSQSWPAGFKYKAFNAHTTSKEFAFSRSRAITNTKPVGSNITAMWTPHHQEVLISGVRQGFKQFTGKGASVISRASVWKAALNVSQLLGESSLVEVLSRRSYWDVKESVLLKSRQHVKEEVRAKALSGWIRNGGDEDFYLED